MIYDLCPLVMLASILILLLLITWGASELRQEERDLKLRKKARPKAKDADIPTDPG